jgi:pyridoxal phosphate enzyme (YggS family)
MMDRLASNLNHVRERIEVAAAKSGRSSQDISLVAVTKYVDAETTRKLIELGCDKIGESRPQILWEKAEDLSDLDVEWHLIGHLQRNKVKRTLPYVSLIHSVDSQRLLTAIDQAGRELGGIVRALVEVNVSKETAKHGFQPSDLPDVWQHLENLDHVSVEGLMGMAGFSGGPDETRSQFASLRRMAENFRGNTPPNVSLDHLSMGMSGDFEIAIEEGATIVRVGSVLFEGIAG